MGIDYQLHRVGVDLAKGFRQFQKADSALANDNVDSAVRHLNKAMDRFSAAQDHAVKAEDDAYDKAGNDIDKGNKELQESIDAYANGNLDRATNHYQKAVSSYDHALDLIG